MKLMRFGAEKITDNIAKERKEMSAPSGKRKADLLIEAHLSGKAVDVESSFKGIKAVERVKRKIIEGEKAASVILASEKITLTDKEGRAVELTALLPGVYFVNVWYQADTPETIPENYFAADRLPLSSGENRKIIFYPGIDRVGDRLSLLHEIGHLKSAAEMTSAAKAEEELFEEYGASAGEGRKKAAEDEILARLNFKHGSLHPVDGETVLDFLELHSRAERLAWAYALRQYREFSRGGFDLEPSLQTFGDIKKFIHSGEALGSYEEQVNKFFPKSPELLGFYSRRYLRRKNGGKNGK